MSQLFQEAVSLFEPSKNMVKLYNKTVFRFSYGFSYICGHIFNIYLWNVGLPEVVN